MHKTKKINFGLKIHSIFFVVFFLLFSTDIVYGSLKYYYLHVGSFQSENKATQFAQDLQKKGLETVVRGEEVTGRGFWYRIYIGPFYSRLEAELQSRDLKKKGITDYAAIHKKDSLISSNLEEKTKPIDKGVKPIPKQTVIEIAPPPEEQAPVKIAPSEPYPVEKKPHITESPIERMPSTEVNISPKKAPPPIKAKPERKVYPKYPSPTKSLKRGYGRNIHQWGLALCLNYSYRDIQTMIIKRDPDQTLKVDEKKDFPTHMHITTMQFRLGLTDYLEILGNAGTAFVDTSELGSVYGGGLRVNLFEIKGGKLKGFYSALQGEYLNGNFDDKEYISQENNKWKKETEWDETTVKVEMGFTGSRFNVYIGGTYFQYNEDTKRQQLDGTDLFDDDIEEENSYGAYGGIAVHFTPALVANIEGELLSQKRISLALTYLF